MLKIKLITTGALSETHWKDACREYEKRLGAYCSFSAVTFKEARLPKEPRPADVAAALDEEAARILDAIAPRALVIALCVEGKAYSSPELAELFESAATRGVSEIDCVIGSAYGLSPTVKSRADVKLSLSALTLPHQLARVVFEEAVYRALDIARGGKYHKA